MFDNLVQNAVNEYQRFHTTHSGYIGPSWKLMKALMWVEGGGPSQGKNWLMRPMQIGNTNDKGVDDVCTHADMLLIAPPEMRRNFSVAAIRTSPALNIQAALGLLHLKMAVIRTSTAFGYPSDSKPQLQSSSSYLFTREKTQPKRYIAAWTPFCPVTIYQRYNVGDGAYARKLHYCLQLIESV